MKRMTKLQKTLLIIAGVQASVLLVMILILVFSKQSTNEAEQTTGVSVATTEAATSVETVETTISVDSATVPTVDSTTVPAVEESTAPTEQPKENKKPSTNKNNGQNSKPKEPNSKPRETQPPEETINPYIQFPYRIPGTSLVIEQISSYDGIFLEDGLDQEASNISIIVLTNTGETSAEYIDISLERDGKQLQFIASGLASGSTAVVMENTGAKYAEGEYTNCIANIATVDSFEMSENHVKIEEHEDGGLVVTNISDEDITCVRIFYKFYMDDMDTYVGGITYTAKLVDLKANSSQTIIPSHYAAGMSKVVMVKTYDTAE